MAKEVDDFIVAWNKFIKTIIMAKKHWGEFRKIREENSLTIEAFPDEVQRILARTNIRSRFVVGVIRFLEYTERFSSLEDCFIKTEKKKEEVENGG